jgi:hypothetical protein
MRIKLYGLIIFPLLMVSLLAAAVPVQTLQVVAPPKSIIYNLYATDGYIPLADGSAIYNYGFVGGRQGDPLTFQKSVTPGINRDPITGLATSFTYNGNGTIPTGAPDPTSGQLTSTEKGLQGNAQFPAPLIYAAVGDVLEIRLKNLGTTNPAAPNDSQSIHLHGLDVEGSNADEPANSIDATPANLCADGTTAPKGENCSIPAPDAGNVVVYMAAAKFAGETFWQTNQKADTHSQLGMYGALVVYSADDRSDPNSAYNHGGPGSGYGGTLYGWKYDSDYVLLESEISPYQHVSVETHSIYNPINYHPTYWALNGLSFPNTIHRGLPGDSGWQDWIAAHPGYDPLITGSVSKMSSDGTQGEKALVRMINVNYEIQPIFGHANKAGRLDACTQYADKNRCDISHWADSGNSPLFLGSGEAYEWLVDFGHPPPQMAVYSPDILTSYDFPTMQDSGVSNQSDPTVSWVMGIGGGQENFPYYNHISYPVDNNNVLPDGLFTALMPLP